MSTLPSLFVSAASKMSLIMSSSPGMLLHPALSAAFAAINPPRETLRERRAGLPPRDVSGGGTFEPRPCDGGKKTVPCRLSLRVSESSGERDCRLCLTNSLEGFATVGVS